MEQRQISTSRWRRRTERDCMSIQPQMNELAGFDAAVGHMPSVHAYIHLCVR